MGSFRVILLAVLTCILHKAAADCSHQGQRCDQCFQKLANYLINTSDNKYNLRRAFYPLERASPVFMTVTYQYIDTNTSNISNTSIPNQTWYWSDGAFYFFQALGVFQFTSLFFGNPELRSGELNINLPAECASAPEEFMTELTQLLKLYASWPVAYLKIDNTYQGKAFNQDTVDDGLYNDPFFNNANQPALVLYFECLFPILALILILVYGCCSYQSIKGIKMEKYVNDPNNWATITAHVFICFTFILYVLALDIAAQLFENNIIMTTALYNKGTPLDSYVIPLFVYDALALVAFGLLMGWCCCKCKNEKKCAFLCLTAAGVVPGLLCLASHAHFIIIAWVLDPIYAASIGIYYGIFYVFHLLVLKQTYKGVHDSYGHTEHQHVNTQDESKGLRKNQNVGETSFNQNRADYQRIDSGTHEDDSTVTENPEEPWSFKIEKKTSYQSINGSTHGKECIKAMCNIMCWCKAMCKALYNYIIMCEEFCEALAVIVVGILTVFFQVLITVFVVYIPINHSVEDTPNRLFTIIHGVGALFLGLIAWKVIVDPRGTKEILSIISSSIRKVVRKMKNKQHSAAVEQSKLLGDDQQWDILSDEDKLTEALHHVFQVIQQSSHQRSTGSINASAIN